VSWQTRTALPGFRQIRTEDAGTLEARTSYLMPGCGQNYSRGIFAVQFVRASGRQVIGGYATLFEKNGLPHQLAAAVTVFHH
jgi:hypothetical protein